MLVLQNDIRVLVNDMKDCLFFFFQAHFLLKHAGNLLGQIVFNETIIGLFGC